MAWLLREHGPFALKAFAVFASAILVTVMFSQLVGTQAAPADDQDDWRFEESTRRLTVAPGASESPQVAWSPSGTLHVAWADTREGYAGVYHKTSANAGWTFSADRALADGFFSVASPSLAVAPRDGLVGIAWQGRPNASSSEQVYVRANSGDGVAWGRAASVGAGRSPVLAATANRLLLAYVHEGVSADQVRLLTLSVVDGSIRDARALVAFNSSASSLALVATGGRAHLAWAEEALGVTAIAHVSVDLATGVVSPVHLVSATRASSGGVALAGRGDRLALAWSDDSAGTFDIFGAYSGTAGESWITGPPVAIGAGNARSPAAAVGARGLVAVVWRDDRTGRSQIFGRIVTLSGTPTTAATRVSDSPSGATEPTVTIGPDRDLIVAWSDARDGETEVYADLDALMDRPRLPTLQTYARRLVREDFAPPSRGSRTELLRLLREANELIEKREESRAIAHLQEQVMPRFDGALGGDPRDDLVVNATAQSEMTRLARGLVDFLRGGSAPGTRTGDGEPNPPPPGTPGGPLPEPIPGSDDPAGGSSSVFGVEVAAITHSNAIAFWNVTTPGPVSSSWADWGIALVSEHRTYDNATPFQATLTPLSANRTYKVRAGAIVAGVTYLSDTFSFYSGVKITGLRSANLSSDKATIEWTTNVRATSVVLYGRNESNLVSTTTGSSGSFHQVNLTGLAEGEYYYRARSAALADATLVRESGTFSTQTGLRVFSLARTATHVAGSYNVTFTWTTNYPGTSDVRYGLDYRLPFSANGTSGTSHAVKIANLASRTTYQWQVYSQFVGSTTYACVSSVSNLDFDRHGIDTLCTPGESAGVDVRPIWTPPIAIMDVTFTRYQTSVLAKWNTTYSGNAVVMWWLGTGSKHVQTGSGSLVHTVNVTNEPTPLATGTTYKFQLNSTASANGLDVARTSPQNVTTKGITLSATTAWVSIYSAIINWTTSGPATTIFDYGISYCDNRVTGADATSPPYKHSVTQTGLRPETTYTYCVRSASLSNLNDIVTDNYLPTGLPRTFKTLPGPNDANTSTDAGSTFATALPVEPGRWNAWVNTSAPYSDSFDFYQAYAFPGAQIRATLTVPPTHNLNLYSYKPSTAASCSSTSGGVGVSESITCNVGATEQGYWRLEVRWISGPTSGPKRGAYVLDFKVVGGGPERFTVDVGASGDQTYSTKTPGISVGTTGWGSPATSTVPSTAVDAYKPPASPYPNYRQVTANGTFYLTLYRTSAERYNDYLFTIQYYGSQNSNVSAWNGAGWVTLVTVPGQTNWQAFSFTLEHTLFYDAEPTWAGMNVKLRFEKAVQIDLISAIPMKHTTYVGSGSDDDKDEYHMPGIRTFDGWVNQGFGYKNASASGATILVTVPDASAGFMVRLRFDGNSSGFTVQRCIVCSPVPTWVFATSTSNYTSGEATFVLDPAWYVDAFSTLPGINAWFRLLPKDRLNQVTQLTLTPVHWVTDVGVAGDNVSANHIPGLSVYPNSEWGNPTTVDGRTVRVGTLTPNLYMNLPWPYGSMIAYVTYKSVSSGLVQLWDGVAWSTIGAVTGGSVWRTNVLFVQGAAVTQGGGGDLVRMFHDDYGDAFVNANLQFTVPVTLDYMWVDVDGDADNVTSFGEPNDYAYDDAVTHVLNPGQAWDVSWLALVEGRWQFDLKFQSYGTTNPLRYSTASVSVDGTDIGRMRTSTSGAKTLTAPAMLCANNHLLHIQSTGDVRVDVTDISFRKVPTDPDRADTDGDGLRDGAEACAKRTDPTNPDTDADGLTDYEEVYQFFYNNANVVYANVTVNVTVNAASEFQWRVKTSASITGGKPTEAVVYLDGQLKWTKKSSSPWTDVEATFDANLPKGLHSLQVQRSTATGTVTLKLVNVTKPRFTNALFWDTDRDGLSDGDELLGRAGWMTSPTKIDTEGDGALDGDEVRTMHTDPLLSDTDYDGYNDNIDLDPLHDLVAQLRIDSFIVNTDTTCSNCLYQARATVAANWTQSQAGAKTILVAANHLLSVNVRDDQSTSIKIQVWSNEQTPHEVDVSTQVGQLAYTATVDLKAPDLYGQYSCGEPGGSRVGCVFYSIQVFRVGKANTLLMTPNDWSTLSNGTVDGTPTGLHRYVGENRFVFVLLNVTDGHGDLVSFDLETKGSGISMGLYRDFSGNGFTGSPIGGASPAPARFALGARFAAAGDYVAVNGPSSTLDWVNGSMTVAFWIKPEADYVSQAGWQWSTGRYGLWRFGFADGKVRFEVTQSASPFTVHAAQATYPLYAGRWYHLAATMSAWGSYTNLSVFVNGNLVAWTNDSAYTARDATNPLSIGYDGATATYFRGVVDEFRLYKTALSQDAIRGLAWFLGGANNVLVPRGVFFDSKLFANLNNSAQMTSGPLAGANVNGNDNKGTASLNARVIQMVITKNATLAQAWKIVDLAATNTTGVVTAFALMVTSEFYTLGLAKEVRDLAANTVVENSGNVSAPPPPPTLWQLFWNTVAGIAGSAWNALAAVGQFFVNVGNWLAAALVGIVYSLVSAAWTYFQQNVLEPLRKALEALVTFVVALIKAIFQAIVDVVLRPILDMLGQWAAASALRLQNVQLSTSQGGQAKTESTATVSTLLEGPFPSLVFGLSTALVLALALLGYLAIITPVGAIAGIIVNAVKGIVKAAVAHWIVTTIVLSAITEWIFSAVGASNLPSYVVDPIEVVWGAFMIWYAIRHKAPLLEDAIALGLNILGALIVFNVLPLAGIVGSKVVPVVLGTAMSAGGLLLALHGEDIAPGALGYVDELLEAATLGFDIAQTAITVSDCVTGRGC